MKNTFGGSLRNSPPITMDGVLMFRSERMRRTGARSTASGTSSHMQSWADCITGTHVSSFWKRQGLINVAWVYYYFSVQFRENLEIARSLYPDDDRLLQLDHGERDTDNLSPWPGVAAAWEKMNHDEFM